MSTDSGENPTAPGKLPEGSIEWPRFTVTISGEVAMRIVEAAEQLNIRPSLYARMMITDGLKNAGLLPKWWKRGTLNIE